MNQQNTAHNPSAHNIDARAFGAAGDGQTDDTHAIQRAIDAAAEKGGGGVWFAPGVYAVRQLQMRSFVGLFAHPTYSYREMGGTTLRLTDAEASCLIDLTGSIGARVSGLSLDGARLGAGTIGIYLNGENHVQEDTLFIENCRIANFTGDGVHLHHVWGFTVRNNTIGFNDGDGVAYSHWDGWIYENVIIGNSGYGIHGCAPNASVSIVGNRIEWNHKGGIVLERGNHYHINDNYIDRSGGPAITLQGEPDRLLHTFAITGNMIYRSGAHAEPGSHRSSHLLFEDVAGLVCTGNAMTFGCDDGGTGVRSPGSGIVLRGLVDSIVTQNTLHHGAIADVIVDAGGHSESTIIRDNVGSLAPPAS